MSAEDEDEGVAGAARGGQAAAGFMLAGLFSATLVALAQGWPARGAALLALLSVLLALARVAAREQRRRVSLQAAYEKLRRDRHEFVAMISHELRTPLTAVVGFSQLLAEESRPSEGRRREYVRILGEQARHLARIIEDVVDLSRIEDGQLLMRPGAVAIGEALEGALALLDSAADRDRIEAVISPDTPIVVADQAELEQVLDRLLHAALRHSTPGERVLVQAEPATNGGAQVAVSARGLDFGPDAFAALRAEPGATSRWRQGERYMGMASARAILEVQGGRIWTEKAGGVGIIRFHLPAYQAEELRTARHDAAEAAPERATPAEPAGREAGGYDSALNTPPQPGERELAPLPAGR